MKTIYQLCEEREQHLQQVHSESEAPLLSLMVDEETETTLKNEDMVDSVLSFLAGDGESLHCLDVYILAMESHWQERFCSVKN